MKNLANEALLTLLGYNASEATKAQIKKVIKNTKGFEQIKKHIVHLSDMLKPYSSHITLSNSHDYLKIKTASLSSMIHINQSNDIIQKWADKYKIDLRKVEQKDTYYILGVK